jgi:hypothetical protein
MMLGGGSMFEGWLQTERDDARAAALGASVRGYHLEAALRECIALAKDGGVAPDVLTKMEDVARRARGTDVGSISAPLTGVDLDAANPNQNAALMNQAFNQGLTVDPTDTPPSSPR